MAQNFGAEIRKMIKTRGMTVSEFARRINKSRENAYDIFRRKSLDTELLSTISQVLDYDFMAKSRERKPKNEYLSEPKATYGYAEQEMILVREELLILRREMIELKNRITALEKPSKKGK